MIEITRRRALTVGSALFLSAVETRVLARSVSNDETQTACEPGLEACGGIIEFAGRNWQVSSSMGELRGPGPNVFSSDPENVYVDEAGRLHLAITNRDGGWQSAEVVAAESLGYGRYSFTLGSSAVFDPNVVLGLFTYLDDNHEIDIELSTFSGELLPFNGAYTLQAIAPGELAISRGFNVEEEWQRTHHDFNWRPDRVEFSSTLLSGSAEDLEIETKIADAVFTNGVPKVVPDRPEHVMMNLWLYARDGMEIGQPPTDGRPVEVIISNFKFEPALL